jgi:flagellar biosynthesis protein FlhF
MRTATFTASSIAEGYAYIRDNFGSDALVVKVEGSGGPRGVAFTVSLPDGPADDQPEPLLETAKRRMHASGFDGAVLARLEQYAIENPRNDANELIESYLRSRLRLRGFVEFAVDSRSLLFLGSPGAGKTTTLAKSAATLVSAGRRVMLVNLERDRLGGASQLEHLAGLLDLPLISVEKPSQIKPALRGAGRIDCILADAPSIHPWRLIEVDDALSLAEQMAAVPVMVVPAGLESKETAENLATVRRSGVEHVFVTKCDVTRRLGTLLNALILERFVLLGLQRSRQLTERIAAAEPGILKSALNLQA